MYVLKNFSRRGKYWYSGTPISYPPYSTIHAIPYFLIGFICGPIWGSFPVRDHLRSNLGIICGPGSFAVLGSFADPYSTFIMLFHYFDNKQRVILMKIEASHDYILHHVNQVQIFWGRNSSKLRSYILFATTN